MKTIIKKVKAAQVTVKGDLVSSIGPGFCFLIGFVEGDTKSDIDYVLREILNREPHEEGCDELREAIFDQKSDVLCIHQSTLFRYKVEDSDSIQNIMDADAADSIYRTFMSTLSKSYQKGKIFFAGSEEFMEIELQYDDMDTVLVDSRK